MRRVERLELRHAVAHDAKHERRVRRVGPKVRDGRGVFGPCAVCSRGAARFFRRRASRQERLDSDGNVSPQRFRAWWVLEKVQERPKSFARRPVGRVELGEALDLDDLFARRFRVRHALGRVHDRVGCGGKRASETTPLLRVTM
uniref:Uncharacterized protein n=1 Tax=Hyaloperonospora arabidopsidis (strain Emoy2) TaxID=559515 RepID=M4C5J7_HYAAE